VRVVSQGACGNEQNKYLKCGGVQEIVCPEGYRCQIPAVYPDAMGTCVPIQGCQKKPVCKAIGTRSEGWYDSCTDKLIRYESCGQETTPLPTSTSASPGSGMDCKTLWWFDNEHKFCQQSKKCGAYMYFGLHTFETKEACEKSLTE